jgi:hypothetical protein
MRLLSLLRRKRIVETINMGIGAIKKLLDTKELYSDDYVYETLDAHDIKTMQHMVPKLERMKDDILTRYKDVDNTVSNDALYDIMDKLLDYVDDNSLALFTQTLENIEILIDACKDDKNKEELKNMFRPHKESLKEKLEIIEVLNKLVK